MSRAVARSFAALLVLGWTLLTAAPALGASSGVSFTATLNGRSTSTISSNDPLVLRAGKPLVVTLRVTNGTSAAVTVSAARINGRVMGLSFFNYDTQLELKIPPGGRSERTFNIGITDLSGQANGLLPASISLLNGNADEVASKDFSVDVKGHLTSIYGLFGLAIAAITVLWLVSLLYRVARRALAPNRWTRAVQFSAAGFGVGLALTFTVSTLRLLTPDAGVWAPFVFGAGFVGLAIGYLTPGPRAAEDQDDDEEFRAARTPAFAGGIPEQAQLGGSDAPAAMGEAQQGGIASPPRRRLPPVGGRAPGDVQHGDVRRGDAQPGDAQRGDVQPGDDRTTAQHGTAPWSSPGAHPSPEGERDTVRAEPGQLDQLFGGEPGDPGQTGGPGSQAPRRDRP